MKAATPRPHWSYSSVSQYLKCPLQYYFERIAKLPRKGTTDAQVLGSAVHSALATYHRKLQSGGAVTAESIRQAYLDAWDDQVKDGQVVTMSNKSLGDSRDLGMALVEVYLEQPPSGSIIAVESPMMAPIANSRGEYLEKPVLIVADLVTRQEDGTLQITEIKTSGRAYYIEAKYGSALSSSVSGDDGQSGYPSDQLIRNIRVGLLQTGYFDLGEQLFDQPPRDFVVLLMAPLKGHPLVDQYRDQQKLRKAIPHSDRLTGLPRGPFVGQIDYEDIQSILVHQSRWMSIPERRVVADLTEYLEFKRANLPNKMALKSPRPAEPAGEMFSGAPTTPLKILSVG